MSEQTPGQMVQSIADDSAGYLLRLFSLEFTRHASRLAEEYRAAGKHERAIALLDVAMLMGRAVETIKTDTQRRAAQETR